MSNYQITNQKDLRRAFWNHSYSLTLKRKRNRDGDYPTDTRVAFVYYIDELQRDGLISKSLAQRATL